MGLLYKLLMPRPVKRARRSITRAAHPVRTATRAVTPKPLKIGLNPLGYTRGAVENKVARAVKGGGGHQRSGPVVSCQYCHTRARGVMCPSCRRRMRPRA
jgi:hypothetical protein